MSSTAYPTIDKINIKGNEIQYKYLIANSIEGTLTSDEINFVLSDGHTLAPKQKSVIYVELDTNYLYRYSIDEGFVRLGV